MSSSRPLGPVGRTLARLTLLAAVAAPLLAVPLIAAPAQASTAATSTTKTTGWLRLAHLSPDTGPVDVWLTPFGGTAKAAALPYVAYGNVSAYQSLAPGYYTVAMRAAGSPASTPAMLSQTVQVQPGKAFSVLAIGSAGALQLRVVADDLTEPGAAKSRVRLIQASTADSAVSVRAVAGPVLVQDAAYGLVSAYSQVPQGRWSLQVQGAGGSVPATAAQVDLRAGTVTTLLVLNAPSGGVLLRPVTDASAAAVLPTGGVDTGEGGTAPESFWSGSPGLAPVGLGLAAMGAVLAASLTRRTRAARLLPER
jgi:Domain of unknown function (DUF4397)